MTCAEGTIITPEFVASYPNVFKPRRNTLNGKEEYSVEALFPLGCDLSALKELVLFVIREKWGPNEKKWPTNLRTPFRDQKEKEKDGVLPPGHVAGAVWCSLRNTRKPEVVDQELQPVIDPHRVYGGCRMRASIRPFAYDQAGNRGVSLSLQNLQLLGDGEPFGTPRIPAEKEFTAVANAPGASAVDQLFGRMK